MKKYVWPSLVMGIVSTMLVAAPVEANDATHAKSSCRCVCKKVTVAMVAKTPAPATSGSSTEPFFNNDFAAQHPSGGG